MEIENLTWEFQQEIKKENPDVEKIMCVLKSIWDFGEEGQKYIVRSIVNYNKGWYPQHRQYTVMYVLPFCEANKIRLTKKLLKKYQ